jgi:hypothetical protein
MRLPGFTAEEALQRKNEIYTAVTIPATADNPGVVPQFWRCVGNTCCDPWSGRCYRCNPWGYCWPISRYTAFA